VGETGNNRVLRFDNAATKANGANADGVLGQADFTSSASATTQSRMNNPRNTIVDSAGQLWVADQGNNRVLRFDNAATKANGANADAVLGQADFTSSTAATTQNGMKQPGGVAVTSSGTLFVGDGDNNRVLRFDNAATKANGANADAVLGQANFTSSTAATTQNGMRSPFGVAYDSEGRLYVSDQWNHRILIFNSAATLANGAPADNVLGQTNFTTGTVNTGGMSASTLYAPIQVFADNSAGVLWAADYGNSRVLRYFSLKTNTTTTLASSQNPSAVGQQVTFTATVAPTSGSGTPTGTVVFKDGGTDITGCSAQALSGGQATCATSSLTAGTHTITADYSGDTNFNTSTGTLTGGQVVNVVSVFKYYFPLVSK
jgi:sugar lactone lactonase YvrE